MELILCYDSNKKAAKIAIDRGFKYGARLINVKTGVPFPIYFADQNWKKPVRSDYMAALAKHRPHMATVLDLERDDQVPEVLSWAEEASQFAEQVIIIPKAFEVIRHLPRYAGNAEIVLGFSVPTKHGGTYVPLQEFAGWPIHLLGGSPHKQMQYWFHLRGIADIVSVDGNMICKMATQFGAYWRQARPHFPPYGHTRDKDDIWRAFQRSCVNVYTAWVALGAVAPFEMPPADDPLPWETDEPASEEDIDANL